MKAELKILSLLGLLLLLNSGSIYAQSATGTIEHFLGISGEFDAPLRVATGPDGNVYITDAVGRAISKYDPSGNLLETITTVDFPVSVAVNGIGQLYIGDGETGNIFRYDEAGSAVEFYSGTEYPSSMVFSPDNTLYVADSRLQEVIALDLSGNVVRTIGSGTVDFPTGLAFNTNNQTILVGEHGGKGTGFKPVVKVWMFDLQGDLVGSFGSHGSGDGQFYRVQGLTVGKCGYIYVVDPFQARISVFDESGSYLEKFGDFGLQPGELNIPMDIVFDDQERLMVSSLNNGSLELFSISDTLPTSTIKTDHEMICSGESTGIEIEFTGTAPWDFTYTVDGMNPTAVSTSENPYQLSVSDAGHYEVTALSDANYTGTCFTGSAVVSVTEMPPSSSMTGDTTICMGETADVSIAFTGSPPWDFTYTVDGLNPVTSVTTNNPHILKVSEAGLYEITDLAGGGCTGTSFNGSAEVVVKQLPTATMTDGNGQIFIDPGDTVELSVALSGVIPWQITYTVDDLNPVSINDITDDTYLLSASKVGTYEIKEISDVYCTDQKSIGYPELVLNSSVILPTSHMDGGDLSICPDERVPISIQFTGTAPWTFTYAVDTLITTTVFNSYTNPYIIYAIYEGSYEVIALSDSNYPGTDFTGYANVSMNPLPVPDYTYTSDYLEVSFTNTSMDADSYLWDFGDGNSSVEMSPVHQYQTAGEYMVTLTASNGLCGALTIAYTVYVEAVSVESLIFEDLLRVYPNPSDGMFTIEITNNQQLDLSLEIINMLGQVIYTREYEEQFSVEEVDLHGYSSGLYMINIRSEMYSKTVKLILN